MIKNSIKPIKTINPREIKINFYKILNLILCIAKTNLKYFLPFL